ncbi:MAG TPA: SAM-dependent methyltransferase [Methylophilus sp.]|nr:SAM-dependent methyltransferase [Methylophilus sp.]HQQ32453.1 SAM-dependent methyltransferase [Methylophilus sp.]
MQNIPEIDPNQSVELLKALHILTRDGKLNQDSRRKLKQVNHLVQFITPLIQEVMKPNPNPTLVDHGAGKSYLGFLLYDAVFKNMPGGQVIGVETRAELVKKSQDLAAECGFGRMRFLHVSAADAAQATEIPERVEIVTALHACDTATDDAIRFGLAKHARYMVLVPCCQAEVARALNAEKAQSLSSTPLSELWRHPIHTREFGSHLANVLRCLQLEAHGYQVTVTELVGWEHAMKNELIIARYTGQPKKSARTRLEAILQAFHLESLAGRFD